MFIAPSTHAFTGSPFTNPSPTFVNPGSLPSPSPDFGVPPMPARPPQNQVMNALTHPGTGSIFALMVGLVKYGLQMDVWRALFKTNIETTRKMLDILA